MSNNYVRKSFQTVSAVGTNRWDQLTLPPSGDWIKPNNDYGNAKQNLTTFHVFVSCGFCAVKSYDLLAEPGDGCVFAHWAIAAGIQY